MGVAGGWLLLAAVVAGAQERHAVRGDVRDAMGTPVAGTTVLLTTADGNARQTAADAAGGFVFAGVEGPVTVRVVGPNGQSARANLSAAEGKPVHLVLGGVGAVEFADAPNFTVAGVTDWTAVGGHGSDATLRASEALTRGTVGMAGAPGAGAAAERRGDPLEAVRQMQRAVALEPNEANYFAWGSELLLHRAVWQAAEVFGRGAGLFPASVRLRIGWGSALFAEAKYTEAAARLCEASDLAPGEREPYVLLGKAAVAAPEALGCAPVALARFLTLRPRDALGNFYGAMLLVRGGSATDRAAAERMLRTAVAVEPGFAEGWLELGVLAAAAGRAGEAVELYRRAIAADAGLAEAHFRLGVALDRAGEHAAAQRELAVHEELVTAQAAAVERERREVKQFVVALGPGAGATP